MTKKRPNWDETNMRIKRTEDWDEIDKLIKELRICLNENHLTCENGYYWLKEAIKTLEKIKNIVKEDSHEY